MTENAHNHSKWRSGAPHLPKGSASQLVAPVIFVKHFLQKLSSPSRKIFEKKICRLEKNPQCNGIERTTFPNPKNTMKQKSEMTATEIYAEVSMLLDCYAESLVLSLDDAWKYKTEAEAFDSALAKKLFTKTRINERMKEARQRVAEEGWFN